jgi:hypothetical protein
MKKDKSTRPRLILDMVHHNPGESEFNSQFSNPEFLQSQGYNGIILSTQIQAAAALDGVAPNVPPPTTAEADWTAAHADKVKQQIADAKAAEQLCLAWTDFVVLPRRIFDALGNTITTTCDARHEYDIKGAITPDIESPVLQTLIAKQIDEIFNQFPQLDGLAVRVGETYLHDLPYHAGGDPITQGIKSHTLMLNLLRENICVKHNKKLLYRTWLSGIDEDREQYLNVANNIAPHPNLIFSIKHCIGDFHRAHPFSPPLGFGNHNQIVEIQCQREYEGKGAYPNYIAAGVIEGFSEYAQIDSQTEYTGLNDIMESDIFSGIWTWSRGGGWQGPYIKNEFWCAMNCAVLVKKMKQPELSAADCLKNFFAESGFTGNDITLLMEIAEKSSDAVLHGVASVKGGINTLWTRDCFIGGIEDSDEPMAKAVSGVIAAGRTAEIIAEREQAVAIWVEIEKLACRIQSGPAELCEFIKTSCSYGRICFEVFAATWKICLLTAEGDESGNYNTDKIQAALHDYDIAWQKWYALEKGSSLCSTLYTDSYCRYIRDKGMTPEGGIAATVERIRKTVN